MEKDDTQATPSLGIFETFKTRSGALTGTARRQRMILGVLAGSNPPEARTRTGISQYIAKSEGTGWKNVYSGIFHDIESVLVPLGLVREAGRIPPKRGPKALQESGIPYYHLSREGILVEAATGSGEVLDKRLSTLFSESKGEEARVGRALALLAGFAPSLAGSILSSYVRAYSDGRVRRLLPLTAEKLGAIEDTGVRAHAEFLAGALELGQAERRRVTSLLDAVSGSKD